MRRRITLGACALLLSVWGSPAAGTPRVTARSTSLPASSGLWATIDVCTTRLDADVVGVRGSMPGTGNSQEQMYMRFRLQYRDPRGVWRYIGPAADSGFVNVGSSRYRFRQAGTNFHLAGSTAAGTVLRGVVIFDWRLAGRTTHHIQLNTTRGHATSVGAVPAGHTAARCTIS